MKLTHGGKRKGAGAKPKGKKLYSVTLTEKNVIAARKREKKLNLSGLLDGLLAIWLRSR